MSSKILVGAAFCVSVLSPNAFAQTPATPEPTPVQQTGTPEPVVADPPVAPKEGFIKRAFKNDEEGDGGGIHWGPFVPRVDVLSSGGGVAPVLHFWMPNIGGSPFDIHASAAYSIYKYQYYDMQIGLLPHKDKRMPSIETGTNAVFPLADLEKTSGNPGFNIYASARYRDYPREDFYGIGPQSAKDAHSDYRLRDGLYEGVIRYQVSRLSLMGRAGLLKTELRAGDDDNLPNVETTFTSTTAPGIAAQPDFIHTSAGAWLELRDEPGNAHRGAAFGLSYSRFNDRDGNAYQFNRLALEGREYLPLGSNRHVIALKQTFAADRPDDGSTVPFYMKSTLGGGSLLRGYPSFRFRDDRLMYMVGEYRFEVHPKVELAGIYELGKVFPRSEDINFKDLRRGYGGGIRIKSTKKVIARLDIMHSDEGNRVHVKLGRTF